ncbi:MTH538 TIR-like domain containing protein [Rhabdaerophilaceae bacterium]
MGLQRINLYLSHVWSHSPQSNKLSDWLFDQDWKIGEAMLDLRDYSIGPADPVRRMENDAALMREIAERIGRSHVVVVPAGLAPDANARVSQEIETARQLRRPVLAIDIAERPRIESCAIRASADVHCVWNDKALVSRIFGLFREQ